MKVAHALLLGLTLTAAIAAQAQYQWVDKDGRRVFSDRPPPADIPAKNVLTQPRGARAPQAAPVAGPAASASEPASAAAAAPRPPAAGVDKALEEKKKQNEAAEAARKKADEERAAASRAENCKRAMSAKATLESGMRMARVNDKGEREVLDDAQRAAELKRVNAIIASDCK
ncbi:hypothetical protein MASR1M50_31720 [Burkholderiales bacterium]|nr:DUF4124 domain-containing protein [Ottowia sp.]HRB09950.1 DUF4124 domain-containing protein [Ottowia sp.]